VFDVFYIGENKKLKDALPFAKQVESYDEISSRTKMYWLVEPNIEIVDTEVFEFRPADHDQVYEHVWKWSSKNYGGVKLLPKTTSEGTKEINRVVCRKSFDILDTPTPENYFEQNPYATHVWCVDSEYKLSNDINWAPDNFEPTFIHSFHLRGQLEHKYPEREGGIKLFPKLWKSAQTKYHGFLDAGVQYPVLYVEDVNNYTQRDKFADEYVWLIDQEHSVDTTTLDWVPNPFEQDFIHCFRMPYQLTEKYPQAMGGIRLVPKEWKNTELKIHPACPIADEEYDVFFIDGEDFNEETYAEYAERSKTEWFWMVDRDFTFNGKLYYVPEKHELDYIHVFKISGHLEERYLDSVTEPWDLRCGGIRLVHKNFDMTKHKYQLGVVPVRYDIFYTNNIHDYETFARKSRTKMFWLVDDEHELNNVFNYVPQKHDQKYIHFFKIPGQLQHKYPLSVTNVSDNRCGGVKLVPVKYVRDDAKYISSSPTGNKQYPILYVEDPNDYSQVTQDCWLIDKEYKLDNEVSWVPPDFQRNMIHSFHLGDQLKHKYPEEMGGIRWVPASWSNAELVVHTISPFKDLEFEKFSSESEGRSKSSNNWFWVIDPNVTVVDQFDFDFIPETWDEGKTHVWQKLNPKTGRQYDYAGVMLCPKIAQSKGRPKYIREAACTQNEFPVLQLDPQLDIIDQLTHIDSTVENSMYWVVDPFTRLHPDFNFDYYPTQWDEKTVHVFANEDGVYRNVRLYPKGTFSGNTLTSKDVANNSFENLKQINTIGSLRPQWPVVHLQDVTKTELVAALQEYSNQEVPFLWTVDPDVSVEQSVLDAGYLPDILSTSKVHVWQRQNPHTQKVHSYGGLRLWPTQKDYSELTTDSIRLNKLKDIQYVKETGSTYKPYDIVFLSYKEPGASSAYERLTARFPATWVKDVAGIFEAHKEAARSVKSKMFWVVDADADIVDTFDFGYIPDVYDQEVVHVWASKNPITGMEYGYGGVKLFNREQVLDATSWGLDFTTGLSSRFKSMPEVSCVTRFNTDAYSTWRSAFRECVKLALKDDAESLERLDGWLHPVPDAFFRHEAKRGAEQGRAYALANKNDLVALAKINDYEWLYEQYKSSNLE
jgi:hypothetical protein